MLEVPITIQMLEAPEKYVKASPKSLGRQLTGAAMAGDIDLLCDCLNKVGDIFQPDEVYRTPMNYYRVLQFAVQNSDSEKATRCTEAICSHVLRKFSAEDLKRLINQEDKNKETMLFYALTKGNHFVVKILLEHGGKLGINVRGESSFFVAAKLENHENAISCTKALMEANNLKTDDTMEECINAIENHLKRTALHRAVISGNYDLIHLLISAGADATIRDAYGLDVFHHAFSNANEEIAVNCTRVLMQDNITANWNETRSNLLCVYDRSGSTPIHVAARRGFVDIIKMMPGNYFNVERDTGFTILHVCASLDDDTRVIREILENSIPMDRQQFLNFKDSNGCTALYIAAKHKNVEICRCLLLAGSAFDIRSKRGKTPLEEVYKNCPQGIDVLLKKSIETSGLVPFHHSRNTMAELNFGMIIGEGTMRRSYFKETEELAKVCYAKFEDRKEVLEHIMFRIYIYLKWERMKIFFILFRLFHILWFLYNCYFLITLYRQVCPFKATSSIPYSWTSLRQMESHTNISTILSKCEISSELRTGGALNIILATIYIVRQFHQVKQKFKWLFRPMKTFKRSTLVCSRLTKPISYYLTLVFQIFPCWAITLACGILVTTLPALGVRLFDDNLHYILAGQMGLLIWVAIFLELGKYPTFRIYTIVLIRSTRTLLFAITVTGPILLGFANVFIILLPCDPSFSSAAQATVKVVTYMIGELDYQGTFYGKTETPFIGIAMIELAVFIIIIVVLLTNFLIGFAAEELKDFREKAEIWKSCAQLEEIVSLESFLDETLPISWRKIIQKHLKLKLIPHAEELHNYIDFSTAIYRMEEAWVDISILPKDLQKEFHKLNLKNLQHLK